MSKGRQSIVSFMNPSTEAFCLENVRMSGAFGDRVRLASCKGKKTLAWNIENRPTGAMVTTDGGKQCLARQWNFAATQPCEFGYTALKVLETNIHDRGFLLATGDGTCFDGLRFKLCEAKDHRLYWGAAVRFDSPRGEVRRLDGRADRNAARDDEPPLRTPRARAQGYLSLFKFHQLRSDPGQKCLLRESSKRVSRPALGDCTHAGAKSWALVDGQLSQDKGKHCVARDEKTGMAKLQPCKDGYTPISWTLFDDRGYYDDSRRSARLAQELAARGRY